MILVTGGAGFIGSNFVLDWLAAGDEPIVILDEESPKADGTSYTNQITFVKDRRGHDQVANVSSVYRGWIDTHYGAASS